jgi:hypothetical protein
VFDLEAGKLLARRALITSTIYCLGGESNSGDIGVAGVKLR